MTTVNVETRHVYNSIGIKSNSLYTINRRPNKEWVDKGRIRIRNNLIMVNTFSHNYSLGRFVWATASTGLSWLYISWTNVVLLFDQLYCSINLPFKLRSKRKQNKANGKRNTGHKGHHLQIWRRINLLFSHHNNHFMRMRFEHDEHLQCILHAKYVEPISIFVCST